MEMSRRFSLPTDCLLANIRPSDGRYALCSGEVAPNWPLQVVDLDTGTSVCEVKLALSWRELDLDSPMARGQRVYWLNDQEILCTGGFFNQNRGASHHWWRFDGRTGKLPVEGDPRSIPSQEVSVGLWPDSVITNGKGTVTEDGTETFLIGGSGKGSPPSVAGRIDLRTLRVTDLGKNDRPVNVFVHETLAKDMLLAFTSAKAVTHFRFSQDGAQLAIACTDGTLEARTIPVGRPRRLAEQQGAP